MIIRRACVVVLGVWGVLVNSQFIPDSPCPDIFSYANDGRQFYGMIRYQPYRQVNTVVMRANFSIKATLPTSYIGQLEVIGAKQQVLQSVFHGAPLVYRVHFPLTSPLPRVISITVNGQMICYGSPEIVGPGEPITTLSLHHMLFAGDNVGGGSPDLSFRPENTAAAEHLKPYRSGNQSPSENGNRLLTDSNRFAADEDPNEPSFVINTVTVPSRGGQNSLQQYFQRLPATNVPQRVDTIQYPQRPPEPPGPQRQRNPAARPATSPIECGMVAGGSDRVALVYHGSAVLRGDWPWLAAVYVRRDSGLQFTCAGTLVSSQQVVTAAHCMHQRSSLTAMSDIVVKVGAFNLDDWSDDNVVTRSLHAADLHFSFNPQTLENDILILTLDKPVTFTNFIRPICTWEGNTDLSLIVGQSGTVVGWGGNELGPSGHGEPRMALLPIVSTNVCRGSRAEFHKLTSSNTLCAGDRNGAGPCNGDSGGGLYMLVGGRWRLRGVVSVSLRPVTGEAVCNLNEYVVFTDTAQYLPWLRQHLVT